MRGWGTSFFFFVCFVVRAWSVTWAPRAPARATRTPRVVERQLRSLVVFFAARRFCVSRRQGRARMSPRSTRVGRLPLAVLHGQGRAIGTWQIRRFLLLDACPPNAMHTDRCDQHRCRPLSRHGMGLLFLVQCCPSAPLRPPPSDAPLAHLRRASEARPTCRLATAALYPRRLVTRELTNSDVLGQTFTSFFLQSQSRP